MFVDDLTNAPGIWEPIKEIKDMGVKVVTVGFGENAKQSQLEKNMAENALHFEEFEFAKTWEQLFYKVLLQTLILTQLNY